MQCNSQGVLDLAGKTYTVEGDTWMDHEFFSDSLGSEQVGWDWLSIQLADTDGYDFISWLRAWGTSSLMEDQSVSSIGPSAPNVRRASPDAARTDRLTVTMA